MTTRKSSGKNDANADSSAIAYPNPVMFSLGDATLVCLPDARADMIDGAVPDDFAAPPLQKLGTVQYPDFFARFGLSEGGEVPVPLDPARVAKQLATASPGSGTVYVLLHAGDVVLFDSGLGQKYGSPARLVAALAKIGIAPEAVTKLWIGTLREKDFKKNFKESRIFPNARVFYSQLDFSGRAFMKKAFAANYAGYIQGDVAGETYIGFERCMSLTGGTSIPRVPVPGNAVLAFLGDAIPFPAIQFENPQIVYKPEELRGEANHDHYMTLKYLVEKDALAAVRNLPFPGLGKVRLNGKIFEFVPAGLHSVPATPAAVAEAMAREAGKAPGNEKIGPVDVLTVKIVNESGVDFSVNGDPNWDDQELLFNGKRKGPIVKPGRSVTVTMEGAVNPNEAQMGIIACGPLTIGNGKDNLLTVTESDVSDLSFSVTDQAVDRCTIVFKDKRPPR